MLAAESRANTSGRPWRLVLRAVRRALAVPEDEDQPRFSGFGCAVVLLGVASLITVLMFVLFTGDIRREMARDAGRTVQRIELILDDVLWGLDTSGTTSPTGCTRATYDWLVTRSLSSRVLDQLHWLPASLEGACSPLTGPSDTVTGPVRTARSDLQGLDQSVILASSTNRPASLLVARTLPDASLLVAEIYGERLADAISTHGANVARVMLTRWDGATLHDWSHAQTPSQDWLPPGEAGESDGIGTQWLASVARSERLPIAITLIARPDALLERVRNRLLLVVLLIVGLSTAVISAINRMLSGRASIERRLRQALRKREFEPVIQPIVNAETGACIGGEILMRWRHPARGLLAPVEFMAVAEQTGLIIEMTHLIMKQARDVLADVRRSNPGLYFTFNVVAAQLRDPGFPDALDRIFDRHSLPPANVVIEVVEREAIDANVRDTLVQLRGRGYRIAIDDFGTGQSSLAILPSVPADILKIDREFVSAIDCNRLNLPVLNAIVDMATQLGLHTVAEGVETIAQHEYLLSRGVQSIQGYLIGKPMLVADFARWLHANAHHSSYRRIVPPVKDPAPVRSWSMSPRPTIMLDDFVAV